MRTLAPHRPPATSPRASRPPAAQVALGVVGRGTGGIQQAQRAGRTGRGTLASCQPLAREAPPADRDVLRRRMARTSVEPGGLRTTGGMTGARPGRGIAATYVPGSRPPLPALAVLPPAASAINQPAMFYRCWQRVLICGVWHTFSFSCDESRPLDTEYDRWLLHVERVTRRLNVAGPNK